MDYQEDILPFRFRGFWSEGACFLRIRIKENKILFFCVQLPNYTGTSVTNAIENVFEAAVDYLLEKNIIIVNENLGFLDKIFTKKEKLEKKRYESAFNYILSNSILIEHYPPGTGLAEDGSFAKVNFGSSGEPAWNYTKKEKLVNHIGSKDALSLDYEVLQKWQEPTAS
jgi:hypothetical protein